MTHIHDKIRMLEIQMRELDSKKDALQAELKNTHAELAKLSSIIAIEVQCFFLQKKKSRSLWVFLEVGSPKDGITSKTGK